MYVPGIARASPHRKAYEIAVYLGCNGPSRPSDPRNVTLVNAACINILPADADGGGKVGSRFDRQDVADVRVEGRTALERFGCRI